ncbi:sulfite exporter TauE/SafE family protein [Pelagibacterium sediminicola]|uniref:sulfite exporter TauE/SafE family protein n=1 Tax=Pelagibacterium sediminicola TaxID=2248761 RepID=UPI000E31C361|nr:sulfite exporter TauE/SafE family protein [Pelagibacterium sediminicola]
MLSGLLPADIGPLLALGLVAFSFVTSAITASFGIGGGIIMLAGLGLVFPPAVLLPVHGLVQFGSNLGRAIVLRAHLHWPTILWFALGAVPGSLLGGYVALALPERLFAVLIAVFILYATWVPQPGVKTKGPLANFLGGLVTSAIGMLVGATGPLVAIFVKWLPDRRSLVGTHAALMTFSHVFRVVAFTLLGFALAEYLPLVGAMMVTGFLGTLTGSRFLDTMPESRFRAGFNIMLTLLALEIVRRAIW